MKSIKSVTKFFDKILELELGKLDIENYIQKVTSNFNPEKLEVLYNDLELLLNKAREDKMGEYSADEIQEAINDLQKRSKQIPTKIRPHFEIIEGKLVRVNDVEYLDYESLLFPYQFFGVYQVLQLIKEYKTRNQTGIEEPKNENKVNSPIVALFCKYINESGLDRRGYDESIQDFCIRICHRFGLRYTDNVRKAFTQRPTSRTKKILIEKLLASMNFPEKDLLLSYISHQ